MKDLLINHETNQVLNTIEELKEIFKLGTNWDFELTNYTINGEPVFAIFESKINYIIVINPDIYNHGVKESMKQFLCGVFSAKGGN